MTPFTYPPTTSDRSEQLARLVYELLDAHSDTARLMQEHSGEVQWRAHLDYLRDLERLGRATLARHDESIPSPPR